MPHVAVHTILEAIIFALNWIFETMSYAAIIHVIDDDQVMRDSLDMLLTSEGYAVRTYASAGLFLDTIRPTENSCIITDVDMPGMDGLELLATLRKRSIFMTAIVLTGCAAANAASAAMALGAFRFFEKPTEPDILLASVFTALELGRRPQSAA